MFGSKKTPQPATKKNPELEAAEKAVHQAHDAREAWERAHVAKRVELQAKLDAAGDPAAAEALATHDASAKLLTKHHKEQCDRAGERFEIAKEADTRALTADRIRRAAALATQPNDVDLSKMLEALAKTKARREQFGELIRACWRDDKVGFAAAADAYAREILGSKPPLHVEHLARQVLAEPAANALEAPKLHKFVALLSEQSRFVDAPSTEGQRLLEFALQEIESAPQREKLLPSVERFRRRQSDVSEAPAVSVERAAAERDARLARDRAKEASKQ